MATITPEDNASSLQSLSTDDVIEKFSDVELVPHGFIDLSLPSVNPSDGQSLSTLHSESSRLLSELDHHSQDITWQMEALVGELMRLGNRLNYEVELLKNEVSGLATEIEEHATPKIDRIASVREKSRALPRLQVLDKARSRMVAVEQVFKDAQQFDETKITNEVVSALNAGQIDSAMKIIDKTANLILIWKGTSQYESRTKFVSGLRKRAEAIQQEIKAKEQLYKPQLESSSKNDMPGVNSAYAGMVPRSKSPENNDGYYGLINQLGRRIF